MKRVMCLALAILFLFLSSCKETSMQDGSVQTTVLTADIVERRIAKLSNPAYYEENDTFIIILENLEQDYAALPENEKREVENYDRLLLAREIYNFDWIKIHAKQKIKEKVLGKFSNPSLLELNFYHIYLYKLEEKVYVLAILDYAFPNDAGDYEERSETAYYLFLPNPNNAGYNDGTEMDADVYQEEVQGTTYYRRPQWQ